MEALCLQVFDSSAHSLLPYPEGPLLAAADHLSTVIYDLDHPTELNKINHGQYTNLSMCWVTSSSEMLACFCSDGNIRLWKINTTRHSTPSSKPSLIRTEYNVTRTTVAILSYDPQRKLLALACLGQLSLWFIHGKKLHSGFKASPSSMEIIHMLYVPERSAFLVFYKSPGSVVEYDVRQKACILHPQISDNIECIAASTDLIAIRGLGSEIRLFKTGDLSTKRSLVPNFIGTISPSTHLHFHEDGSLIIGTTTGEVEIWDVGSMSLIGGFQARGNHLRVVTSISHGRSTFNILLETSAGLEVWKINRAAGEKECLLEISSSQESQNDLEHEVETASLSQELSQASPSSAPIPHIDFIAISRSARIGRRSLSRDPIQLAPRQSAYTTIRHSILTILFECFVRVLNLGLVVFVLAMLPRYYEITSELKE